MTRVRQMTLVLAVAVAGVARVGEAARKAAPAPILTQEFDRFEGHTTIRTAESANLFALPKPMIVLAQYTSDPTGAPSPEPKLRLMLSLRFYSDNWRYLRCHSVNWLADGQKLDVVALVGPDHSGDVRTGGVTERINYAGIPKGVFMKLAAATVLEYQVCNDAYRVKPSELEVIREIARRVESIPEEPIMAALGGGGTREQATEPPKTEFSCTPEQRSLMATIGLSKGQIAAACGESE